MLMSFCTDAPASQMVSASSRVPYEMSMALFRERLRSLLRQYAASLQVPESKRQLLTLSPQAAGVWNVFCNQMEHVYGNHSLWTDVRPFVMRAAEHVVRLAAVFHRFCAQDGQIAESSVWAASNVVMWHLGQAKTAFGEPPLQVQVQRLAHTLHDYLLQTANRTCYPRFGRSELLRCGPKSLRNADCLNLALQQLVLEQKVQVISQKGRAVIELVIHRPPLVPYNLDAGRRLWS